MLRSRNLLLLQRRWKSKRWNVQQNKKTNTQRALESFDDFYGSVFGLRWRNIRAALLTEHKYIALVNNFGDTEKTCSMLEMDGAISVKALVNLAKEHVTPGTDPQIVEPQRQIDDALDDLVRIHEQREKSSLYPEGTDESPVKVPDRLQYRDETNDSDKHVAVNEITEKRLSNNSLEKAITENSNIDNSRFIDPQYGTGALHEFVPANRIKGKEDWIPESDHYKYYQTHIDFPLNFETETEFVFPQLLNLYTYEIGNCAEFQPPRNCLTGVLSHYLMDGASILPPLMLDIKHGERVLDACAAPGGKSLLMLQTLHPDVLVCNDIQESRVNRIRKVMQEYLFDFKERWEHKRLVLSQCDARNLDDYNSYDKILVDVPCTTDRHSLKEDNNNIFKPTRIKERLRIPELQAGILENCLRLLKPGGSLVYSTCALSPVQNDGVVHMALQKVFNEYGITVTIKDLRLLTKLFADIFKFENPKGLKYGQMVIPYLPANFGPMYFCKITRDT